MKIRKGLFEFAAGAIGGAVLSPLLRVVWKLIENACLGWADQQIGQWISQHLPVTRELAAAVVAWGPPMAITVACLIAAFIAGSARAYVSAGTSRDLRQVTCRPPWNGHGDIFNITVANTVSSPPGQPYVTVGRETDIELAFNNDEGQVKKTHRPPERVS